MDAPPHSANSNASQGSRGGYRGRGRGGRGGRGRGGLRTPNASFSTQVPVGLPSPAPAKRGRPALLDRLAPSTAAGLSTSASSSAPVSALSSHAPTPIESSTPRSTRPGSPNAADGEQRRFAEFVERGILHPGAIQGVPFEYATGIQSYTIEPVCAGKDILAQARTGQGKTLAALIPALDRLLRSPPTGRISVLVISPTRELAMQIADAAEKILAPTPYRVQYVVGGRDMNKETKALQNQKADFLIATPGRLGDHIQNGVLKDPSMFGGLKVLVLDECDRLLDQGFRPEINRIVAHLNAVSATKDRQTLLFSATVPPEVKQVIGMTLKKDYVTVSTVSSQDQQTHEHVPQFLLQVELAEVMPTILNVLQREIAQDGDNAKVMVFLPTARAVSLLHDVFSSLQPPLSKPVWEINSRMSQSARTKASEQFRNANKGGILISSDVTARGMDFPGVSAVVQAGLPASAEQYIHRLGRTARAGADGRGILILSPFEQFFLRKGPMQTMPLQPYPVAELAASQQACRDQIDAALTSVPDSVKGQAYSAWLGFYKSSLSSIKWTPAELVSQVNNYARILKYVGEPQDNGIPPIPRKTIGKMQLKGVPGLNAVADLPSANKPRR